MPEKADNHVLLLCLPHVRSLVKAGLWAVHVVCSPVESIRPVPLSIAIAVSGWPVDACLGALVS